MFEATSHEFALLAPTVTDFEAILTPSAQEFLHELHTRFQARRAGLLAARKAQQARFDADEEPDFLPETLAIRTGNWRVAPIPEVLKDRRVEITGPVDRKMIINAMNSGACVFMADFEDSTSPTWEALIQGQINLRDAVRHDINFTTPEGKLYALKPKDLAILMVRPRGWHLDEKHVRIAGESMSASLFDFGLFAFHNAHPLMSNGLGPFFYLPKLQSHLEAALWDEVMSFAEVRLGLPIGTMKVTVLIETLPAVFEMDEILYALKGRITGLNCGRWDYIFSYIKTFRAHPARVLPERKQIAMTVPFLKAYSELLIQTCHRRGAFAMGGMAAQIPIARDAAANELAMSRVRTDKIREVKAGHDGTWVAHPGLIAIARAAFDEYMPAANQLHILRDEVRVMKNDLLAPCAGTITRAGFLNNIDVCVRYLAAWLDGLGCVPINNLMEDAATAEISRAQLWQWLHVGGLYLEDGAPVDFALFDAALGSVHERVNPVGLPGEARFDEAQQMLGEWTHACELVEFLTVPGYEKLP